MMTYPETLMCYPGTEAGLFYKIEFFDLLFSVVQLYKVWRCFFSSRSYAVPEVDIVIKGFFLLSKIHFRKHK